MNEEERLILNNYLEDLYQAMQIGDIVYEPKRSSELYNLINKLLKENQKYKEVINKAIEYIEQHAILVTDGTITTNKHEILEILKEVEDK